MNEKAEHGTNTSYVVGFFLSILLTLIAYFVVVQQLFSGWVVIGAITTCAIIQLLVQLLCFLHMGSEMRPRLKLLVFISMVVVLAIIVTGTLWIMHNLDTRVMPTMDVKTYMHYQE